MDLIELYNAKSRFQFFPNLTHILELYCFDIYETV